MNIRLKDTGNVTGHCFDSLNRADWQPYPQTIQWNHFGSTMIERTMPTTLTLKNIPDEVYKRLKAAAEMHRRSLNSEAIVCLETVLAPVKVAPSERLARARQLRATLGSKKFRARDIDLEKRRGRP